MELYIHIPFCKSKCQYCDFISFKGCDEVILDYSKALIKEIELSSKEFSNRTINTVYIGGGTPSYLPEKVIKEIVIALNKSFDLSKVEEFTIECNPESITENKLKLFKSLGINRLSLGIQSLNDDNLKEIGRIHDRKTAIEKLKLAYKYFTNLSCDLIIGLPFDTKELIREEVSFLSNFVSHISMYELIVEEGTKLYERVTKKDIKLPSDDEVVDLFNEAINTANICGLFRYEVSNFAKNGMYSKHNFGYWIREEYLGLGLNSSSLIKDNNETRFSNLKSLDEYIKMMKNAIQYSDILRTDVDTLSNDDILNEKIMLGLRTSAGIDKNFIDKVFLEKYKDYFILDEDKVSLNDNGMSIMNTILVDLLK